MTGLVRSMASLAASSQVGIAPRLFLKKLVAEVLDRVVSVLQRRGELDDTVILFTSDHGCHFKTRNSEYKRSVHDASVRVPTVLRGPGLRGGVRLPELVGHVDLPPTLLQAAGLPVVPCAGVGCPGPAPEGWVGKPDDGAGCDPLSLAVPC